MRLLIGAVKVLSAILLCVVLFLGGWLGWLSYRYHASTPDYSATIVSDKYAPTIARDENGVVHISGQSDGDVWFGLGYAHAQDRLFEMDMMRRSIWGTVGEVIPAFISPEIALSDARARMRGHDATARAIYENLPAEGKAALGAYADGVNAFIDQKRDKWPFAYALLLAEPEPWKPQDTVTASLMMTHMLSVGSGHSSGPNQPEISDALREAREIYAGRYPDDAITSFDLSDLSLTSSQAAELPSLGDFPRPGSNNWVLSGARTASGLPLLANDPHLPPGLPSIWFLARLSTPSGDVVGATIPGVPYIVIGRNDHIAWGITNSGFDVRDSVALERAGPVEEQTALVKRRFARDVEVTITRTPLGFATTLDAETAIQTAVRGKTHKVEEFRDYVVRQTDDDEDNLTAFALHELQKARSVENAITTVNQYWVAPVQTLVLADRDGNIALTVAGRTPLRGADGEWLDDLQAGAGLSVFNPQRGFAASANNRMHPVGFPYPIPGNYALDRIERIYELIEAEPLHTMQSAMAMQLDITSPLALRLKAIWIEGEPETEAGQELQRALLSWDGRMEADLAEPALYSDWVRHFTNEVSRDERELTADDPVDTYLRPLFLRSVVSGEHASWCDNSHTEDRVETCAFQSGRAFDLAALSQTDAKVWGERRRIELAHPLLSRFPIVGSHYRRTARVDGDGTTLNVAHARLNEASSRVTLGTNLRMIVDFADPDGSLFVHAPGQSAHPRSPYFDNLLNDWAEGRYITIPTGKPVEEVAADGQITRTRRGT